MAPSTPAEAVSHRGPPIAVRAAQWLSLGATPAFVIMALLTGNHGDAMAGMTMPDDPSPLSGMAVMYALMAVFHLSPWLKLVAGRRGGANAADPSQGSGS